MGSSQKRDRRDDFQEEEIMVPMTLDVFSLKDWEQIAADSFDIGLPLSQNRFLGNRAKNPLKRNWRQNPHGKRRSKPKKQPLASQPV